MGHAGHDLLDRSQLVFWDGSVEVVAAEYPECEPLRWLRRAEGTLGVSDDESG